MDVFDAEMKDGILPQHIPDLSSGMTFVSFNQEKPLQQKEINTHR